MLIASTHSFHEPRASASVVVAAGLAGQGFGFKASANELLSNPTSYNLRRTTGRRLSGKH